MTYIERIHNTITKEILERPFTVEEINQLEALKVKKEQELEIQAQAALQAATAKAAAEAKLVALGLTSDDLKALGL